MKHIVYEIGPDYGHDDVFDFSFVENRTMKRSARTKECRFDRTSCVNLTSNYTIALEGEREITRMDEIDINSLSWKSIKQEDLDLEYAVAFPNHIARGMFAELEDQLEYFTGDLAKIKLFGKVFPLPRQQVAYGDEGITYTYSGITVPALPWPDPVLALRNFIVRLKGIKYDFVLVNRYRNGNDHMGEHRDNEPELDPSYPIASISLGQERPFILKHKDARKPGPNKKRYPPVYITLEDGSILFMNPPTNEVWYHSLPTRKKLLGARINLTFRKMRKIN